MGVYGKCITDDDSKAIKKLVKKYSKKEINSFNDRLRGSFTIVGFRKYQFTNEVDIEFNGEICARHSSLAVLTWFKSDIYNQSSVSKIKVNKLVDYKNNLIHTNNDWYKKKLLIKNGL